jgi:PPIC-type PPIASE domain.
LDELPEQYQPLVAAFESKKRVVEQLLLKELLAEEYGDNSQSDKDKHGMDDLRANYLKQVMHAEEIDKSMPQVTEEEAREFYAQNISRMRAPAQMKIGLIRIRQGMEGEKSEQAKARADEALSALRSGADFSETAKLYSDDAGATPEQWLLDDEAEHYFGKGLKDVPTNSFSGVLEAYGHYFIVKVSERQAESEIPFEEMQGHLTTYLSQKRHADMEQDYRTKLMEKANLVIYEKTLRSIVKKIEEDA